MKLGGMLAAVVAIGLVAVAAFSPKARRARAAGNVAERIEYLETRCADLENEVEDLKRAVYNTSGRVNDLEVSAENRE